MSSWTTSVCLPSRTLADLSVLLQWHQSYLEDHPNVELACHFTGSGAGWRGCVQCEWQCRRDAAIIVHYIKKLKYLVISGQRSRGRCALSRSEKVPHDNGA